ncbi:mechanosensitive ion channel family protein [Luteimonas fraxinea]|uniref:Mechanosensitive ion channel family protein n=1 Tax=Luteimonas fraxinea TaxID=2901869 RepID=A0ABS8UFS6_9GAMM|nr:mechanosensitive ion channel domain-containing protein [Luteimonas fraxinea]MCD9098340.1 mechanosensitive ion channel family protein [Luteimonas fraxinea]MCD9127072.1 mechanosensitive ion channel family protein [Luteimonas fraxinea]UHH08726.1 mechanosensitive ion channel family protein [Luteimonas fraxinea]
MSSEWTHLAAIAWPLLVALILGVVVHWSLRALARAAGRRAQERMRARIAYVVAVPAAVGLPLLFLSLALNATPIDPDLLGQLRHWIAIGGMLCLTWLVARTVGAVEERILLEHPVDVEDNLAARRVQTQARVISRVIQAGVVLVGVALALMTFPQVRQVGAGLLASAGIIGLIAGVAAQPVFGNLIAGLQIALAQPIRLDDVVIVEGEWGRIEEITSTYVVVRIWDERRLVVPLQWFISNPFQNWTRTSAQLLGTVFLWLDHRAPIPQIRDELQRICEADPRWDRRVCVTQITETDKHTIEVRLLVSARNSGELFDLRCAVREGMLAFLDAHHPQALPRVRNEVTDGDARRAATHAVAPVAHASTQSPGAETAMGTRAEPDLDTGLPSRPAQ